MVKACIKIRFLVLAIEIPHAFVQSKSGRFIPETGHFFIRYSSRDGAIQCTVLWGWNKWQGPAEFGYEEGATFPLSCSLEKP